jgi:hypothetical protein
MKFISTIIQTMEKERKKENKEKKKERKRKERRKERSKENRCKSINSHRFPKPHLSRRGDKRVEMRHWPQRGQSLLISSHMDVHSAHPYVRRKTSGWGRG